MPIVTIGANTTDDFSGVADTRIYESLPNNNYGTSTDLETSKFGPGDHQHSIIKFEGLSNIPSGSTINSVTLSLNLSNAGGASGQTVSLRRLLRDWVESTATWNIYDTGLNWTTGGGLSSGNDRVAAVSDTITGVTSTLQYYTSSGNAQLATDVKNIIDGVNSNYGWHLERTDGADDATFRVFSSSNAADGVRPYLTVDYTEPSSLTLDSTPTDVNSQTQESSVVSNPATAPTTLNSEVKFDNDLGPAATVNSVTGSDPYTLNYTFPRTTAKKFDATGYPLYHEVDAESVTSGNVPYLPVAEQTYTDLSSPVNTAGTLGETYAGSPAATGDQWVYDTNLTGDAGITLTVDAQGYWTLSGTPSTTSTASFYRIDSTGSVDVEDTITFTVAGSGKSLVSPIVSNIVSNIVSEV